MAVIRTRFQWLMGLLAVALMFAPGMLAQSYYGTLKGSVTDSQGAAIAGATVTLTDVNTKIARTAVSNGAGEYLFSAVDPGTFDLTVTSANFQTYVRKGVNVATQQTVTIDTPLAVGASSTTVEVTADAPLVDSSTASNGQVFDTQKLQDLPNLGRNPFLLTKLNTNVTATGDPRFNRFQDQSGSSAISVSGGPINGNNYEIDGVPVTDFSNRAVIIPSVDAVQEMKIQTNTYDAEMGRTGGGNFNTLLKSGTNTLHGNLLGTTRQTNWSANTWNNNYNGTGRPNITQYTYEGSIGGPVVIPHLYNGKDKTFFWLTEEGYRQRSPLATNYYLPTAAERSGDFSSSYADVARTTQLKIYDPATTGSTGNRTQFAGNIIPSSRQSAIGQKILAALPTCTSICTATTSYGGTNFRPTDLLGDRADEFVGKLDHQITQRWAANISYMHYGSKEPGGNPLGSFAGDTNSYLLYRKVDATTVNTTYTLNPTTVLTVGWGFNRFPNNTLDLTNNYDQTQLGLPSSYVSALQKKSFPRVTLTQINAQLGTNNSGPAAFYSRNFVAGISKSLGKQSLKGGYVYRSISVDFTNVSNGNGFFTFNNTFTAINANSKNVGGLATGADIADLLLGYPTTGQVQIASKIALNVPYHAFYIQDDYRLTSRLTLNAGLRYEYEPGVHERNNKYAIGFDRTVSNPISSTSGVATKGGIMFAGQNGYPTTCCNNSNTKFAPRIGLVYSLDQKTVVRAGYGVFYAPIYYSTSASLAPGYVSTTSYVASNDSNNTPANSLANPYPNGINQPVGNSLGYSQGLGDALTTIDQNRRSPVVQQYSLDIQRELPYGVALQLGYVGSKGRNLLPGNGTTYNLDQVNLGAIPYGQGACPANTGASAATFLNAKSSNPYYNKGGIGAIAAATVANSQLCKPFPEFTTVSIQPSNSKSLYNSMIIKAQKKMAHGATFVTALTWSSNWDSSFGQGSSLNPGNNGPQDIYNLNGEYARAINNTPLRYTAAGTWQLPFGRGRAYLSHNRWIDLAVGGWDLNSTFVAQQGGPVPIQLNTNNNSGYGNAVQRPNLVPGVDVCTSGSVQSRNGQNGNKLFFNTSAFADPGQGNNGNAPRTIGSCQAPGYRNVDASIFKDFHAERVTMQFRAEFMNLTNTPQFAISSAALKVGSSSFGQVSTNAINFPRLITLGGKIMF
ncbi:TonB-dependent receptor [Terriglobus albidus]|uniref:TonB-dependent receptor n=1 Tax=Terriglobus albidus TaxID=1592106 RepID=UPI0021E09B39|nr:TonB-dependent receptor [Terriglobus albidus]